VPSDAPLLGGGWYGPEVANDETFRWCRKTAMVWLPLPSGDAAIHFRLGAYAGVKTQQTLVVEIDGVSAAELALAPNQETYVVNAESRLTPDIVPVTFRFERETSPAEVGESLDDRPLSAAFEWIEVRRPGEPSAAGATPDTLRHPPPMPILFRPDGTPLSAQRSTARACRNPLDWSDKTRDRVRARLGIARESVERVRSREDLADLLIESLPLPECMTDAEFLDLAYLALLGRHPDRIGRTYYLAGLASEWSREEIVCKLASAME